jgi:hypothetical protein
MRTRCFLSKLGAHFRGKGEVGPTARIPAVDKVPGTKANSGRTVLAALVTYGRPYRVLGL